MRKELIGVNDKVLQVMRVILASLSVDCVGVMCYVISLAYFTENSIPCTYVG